MAVTQSNLERAEAKSRARAILMALASLPLLFTAISGLGEENSAAPWLRHAVWIAMVLLWLVMLATGGFLRDGGAVRQLMNDEVAQLNRHRAIETGFWTAMAAAIFLSFAPAEWDLTLRQGMRILLSVSIAVALLRYAWSEWR